MVCYSLLLSSLLSAYVQPNVSNTILMDIFVTLANTPVMSYAVF
jgi:hypothetical protein